MGKSKKIISTLGSYAGYKSMSMWSGNLCDPGKGTFDSGTESWAAYGTNTIANDAGALKISGVDDSRGARCPLTEAGDLTTDLIVGKVYNIHIKAKRNAGDQSLRMVDIGGYSSETHLTTSYEWYSILHTATSTTTANILCNNMSAGEIIWIDEWSIYKRRG